MNRFKNILCVVELGKEYKPALERAVTLAENNQANLNVITATSSISACVSVPAAGANITELHDANVNNQKQALEDLVEPYRGRTKIETRVLVGTPFLEIIREVLRDGYDLVIKCSE